MLPLALLVLMTATPASVRCDDARRVVPSDVKKGTAELRRELTKRRLRITDLPSDGLAAHRLLLAQIRTRAWCGADEQLRVVRASVERMPMRKAPAGSARPGVTAFAAGEELPEKEVAAGCPGLEKSRTVGAVLDDLATKLDTTQVRAIEIRRGTSLLEQLEQAVRLHDHPKAVRTACVLRYRADQVTDGLDRAMARFQRVNVLRDTRGGVAEAEKPRFESLVNEASRQIAARDYSGARATLETLLVFLGDAERPSGNLPRP